jgi:hypothetical protein
MLWFFQRGNEYLRVETTHNRKTGTFALTVYRADGVEETETFVDQRAFESRLEALEQQLSAQEWISSGSALLPIRSQERPH